MWPEDQPLDFDRALRSIWEAKGNLRTAARLMGTDEARLGYLLSKDEELAAARAKAADLVIDRAEENVIAALDDPDDGLEVAKWVLTNAGRSRGWGTAATTPLGLSFGATAGAGQIAIRWQVDEPAKP